VLRFSKDYAKVAGQRPQFRLHSSTESLLADTIAAINAAITRHKASAASSLQCTGRFTKPAAGPKATALKGVAAAAEGIDSMDICQDDDNNKQGELSCAACSRWHWQVRRAWLLLAILACMMLLAEPAA
jgi:hypothetical protein